MDVAEKIGVSRSTLSQRLSRGKFTKQELLQIAAAIGCEYYSAFRFGDGVDISAPTIGNQIKDALTYANMSRRELAIKLGVTSPAVSSKLVIGKYTQAELIRIANHMGCEYISEFRLHDGTVI